MKDFYLMESQSLPENIQVYCDWIKNDLVWNNLLRGHYSNMEQPLVFVILGGKKWCDLLNTGWPGLYVISDNFRTILEDNKISGWKVYQVVIESKNGKGIYAYHGLSFTGKCGELHVSKSNIVEKPMVQDGPKIKYHKGCFFDINTWDNSDMFMSERKMYTLVTKKVVSLLVESGLTNLHFTSLDEIEIPEFAL